MSSVSDKHFLRCQFASYSIGVNFVPTVFCLLVGAAGWYYMFYSRAAVHLEGIELIHLNMRRRRLRRIGGFIMMLLAAGVFALFNRFDPVSHPAVAAWILLGVLLLLAGIVVLGLLDLRLTWRLRTRSARRE